MIKDFFREIHNLIWTLSGIGLVLITLSGQVLEYALWISGVSLLAHLIGFLFFGSEGGDDEGT